MKVLLMSTSDIKGGAARAAYRLHKGLQQQQVDSEMLVTVKYSDDEAVIGSSAQSGIGKVTTGLKLTLDQLPLKLYAHTGKKNFSPHWISDRFNAQVARLSPDIINLHWVSAGYLQIETIAKFKQPLVWTLHDMWAFTGGCHYNQECDRYMASCGSCPQLGSKRDWDLSRWIWRRKAKAWQNLNLTLVTPSSWLGKCAHHSSLFQNYPLEVIPNGIDTSIYRPFDRKIARELLHLPQDKKLILFGAMSATSDRRKGFAFLQQALQELSQSPWQEQIELVIFGASEPKNAPELGLKSHYLGKFEDDLSLALVYAAADVFVLPSVQENLANTVLESLACGTPCVAFNLGGNSDMIEHQQNGYLVAPYQTQDLAQGIIWLIENETRYQKLSDRAQEKVRQEFTLQHQAQKYIALFEQIITKNSSN